jgi:hypothetical protein
VSDYPEHDKLALIKDQSQAIGEFIEWLERDGIHLASRYCLRDDRHPDWCENGCEWSTYMLPIGKSISTLLAKFFKIDQDTLEREKRAMLASIRGDT